MSLVSFELITVVRVLTDGTELAEALGFPEISAAGETTKSWRTCLEAKARALLVEDEESATLRLHRRRHGAAPQMDVFEFSLAPPARRADWREPVPLRFHFVYWEEEGGLNHAFAPALQAHVFAPRADLLRPRLEAHARLLLQSKRHLTLAALAATQTTRELRIERLTVSAALKTPRQRQEEIAGKKKTPSVLPAVAADLTKAKLAPAYEIDDLVVRLSDALGGAHARSVLLVGPSGSGRTALVHEFVRLRGALGFGRTPFWSTSGARLVAGQCGYGMWQQRCRDLCREAAKTGAIVHLGSLAELAEVGRSTRQEQSIGGFLRPSLARGELLAIAECTPEQLGAIERVEPSLTGVFQQLSVPEPPPEATRRILGKVWRDAEGEAPSQTEASEAALDWLHRLHQRYATYSANPGRPLRFLRHLLADEFPNKALSVDGVTAAFTRETGLPQVLLDDRIGLDLDATRAWFTRRVIGQPDAVNLVLDLLATIKARLARPRKPLASLLLIGPTGTGKTELARALAEFLFGDAARVARFDMSEFSDARAVQRLIGGTGEGAEGLLTARVREQPFTVLLLDEFEKADPSFFDLLLQILGDGRLTDAAGRTADFCNAFIVMTSNLGAESFQRGAPGFRKPARSDLTAHFDGAVRQFLRPEIYNRLDALIPFHTLTPEVVRAITARQLELIRQRDGIRLRPLAIDMAPELVDYLAQRGYDPRYGARPLRRTLERELVVPLAETLGAYADQTPLRARLALRDERVVVDVRSVPARERTGDGLAAHAVVEERRRVQRLCRCPTVSGFENEATTMDSLRRRLDRSPHKSREDLARLDRLRKLRQLLDALQTLLARAHALESEALAVFYAREPMETEVIAAELAAIASERVLRSRDALRFSLAHPDDAVLAIFSEQRDWLLRLTSAYLATCVTLRALDYFTPPPKRTPESTAQRTAVPKVDKFFDDLPEYLLGVVFHLQGELLWPRIASEGGLHVFESGGKRQVCLVEVWDEGFADYQAPARIDRQGSIAALGAELRRTYRHDEGDVIDARRGKRPWSGERLASLLGVLFEEELQGALDALTS